MITLKEKRATDAIELDDPLADSPTNYYEHMDQSTATNTPPLIVTGELTEKQAAALVETASPIDGTNPADISFAGTDESGGVSAIAIQSNDPDFTRTALPREVREDPELTIIEPLGGEQ